VKTCIGKKKLSPHRKHKPHTFLSIARTRNLRARAQAGENLNELAVEYKVHPETVRNIKNGKTRRGM
jgi:hypothetical protein